MILKLVATATLESMAWHKPSNVGVGSPSAVVNVSMSELPSKNADFFTGDVGLDEARLPST